MRVQTRLRYPTSLQSWFGAAAPLAALCSPTQTCVAHLQDDGYISPGEETQVLQTLAKLRKRDASIYDKDTKFYSSGEEEAGRNLSCVLSSTAMWSCWTNAAQTACYSHLMAAALHV